MTKRTLTVQFSRAITSDYPGTMEVSVIPLSTAGNSTTNAVFVGGPQVKTVLLANEVNSVTFDLVPSEDPDLDTVLTYRIAWRDRYLGRQYTTDFTMPDQDVEFADLGSLGNIISSI